MPSKEFVCILVAFEGDVPEDAKQARHCFVDATPLTVSVFLVPLSQT